MVSTFTVVPGGAPAMVSFAKRSVTAGDELGVRFHAATDDGRIEDGRIAIVASGGKAEEPLLSMGSNNGTDRSNVAYFGTVSLAPGGYDAVLTDAEGKELARAPFWITAPGAVPALSVDKADYTEGEPITVKCRTRRGIGAIGWASTRPAIPTSGTTWRSSIPMPLPQAKRCSTKPPSAVRWKAASTRSA